MLKLLGELLKKGIWQNVLAVLGGIILFFILLTTPTAGLFLPGLKIIYYTFPVWLPLLSFYVFISLWLRYIRGVFIEKQGSVLLEIKLPKEITKSPFAMEVILTALYQAGNPKNHFETYWDGKVPPWFSLEIISEEGKIRFFIWAHKKFKNMIEAQIYAQYPGVEIFEVNEDYTAWLSSNTDTHPFWATCYKKKRASPFPIKTYIDFGLDRDPKEEFKIDPMTSTIEMLGSMKQGEWIWIQILIQAHRKETYEHGRLFTKPTWHEEIKEEIKEVIKKSKKASGDDDDKTSVRLTKTENDAIAAMERSYAKFPFDTAIRAFYISTPKAFNSMGISGIIGQFRQYASNYPYHNEIGLKWYTDPDHWYQNIGGKRKKKNERQMLDAYRKRSFFQLPYKYFHATPFVMTTEELATIYHFPGAVAGTPTFERIASKKGEAPANLPL